MAKIVRSTQKIFGANAAQNQVTEFGSIKAGGAVYSKNVNDIQTEAFEGGWSDALQDDYAPYRQDRNALDFVMTSQLAYLFQDGVPEWDSGTTYYKGAIVKVIASNGAAQLYVSLADNNTYTFTNASYWSKFLDTSIPFAKDADVVKLTGNQTIGGVKTLTSSPILNAATANMVAIVNANKQLTSSASITTTELNYLDGVTSNIQTQLNAKQASITGGASTITTSNLTVNRALISNASGKVVVSDVTSTEIAYLDGVSSNIQTQLNGKANTSASNFNATGKSTILGWGIPNYSAGIDISSSVATGYTVPKKGVIIVYTVPATRVCQITLNGVVVLSKGATSGSYAISSTLLVDANDVITVSVVSDGSIKFFPFKGV